MSKLFIFTTIFVLLALASPVLIAYAQNESEGTSFYNPVTPIGDKPMTVIIGEVLQKALGVIGILAIIIFLIAGFVWMTAQGDAKKIKTAQTIMAWAGVGLLVIFSSYIILKFIFGIIK